MALSRTRLFEIGNAIIYNLLHQSFTIENGGLSDSASINEDLGRELWQHLLVINYQLTDHNIPNIKASFFFSGEYRQKRGEELDVYWSRIFCISNMLQSNGHVITDRERGTIL